MKKLEAQEIFFNLYDKHLSKDIAKKAKRNWDYEFGKNYEKPENILEALNYGFDWWVESSFDYWEKIHDSLDKSTPNQITSILVDGVVHVEIPVDDPSNPPYIKIVYKKKEL